MDKNRGHIRHAPSGTRQINKNYYTETLNMAIEVRKKEGENVNALLYRFNKKMKESGVMKTVKKKRFTTRAQNKGKRRLAALYREEKGKELRKQKKLG